MNLIKVLSKVGSIFSVLIWIYLLTIYFTTPYIMTILIWWALLIGFAVCIVVPLVYYGWRKENKR